MAEFLALEASEDESVHVMDEVHSESADPAWSPDCSSSEESGGSSSSEEVECDDEDMEISSEDEMECGDECAEGCSESDDECAEGSSDESDSSDDGGRERRQSYFDPPTTAKRVCRGRRVAVQPVRRRLVLSDSSDEE